MHANQHANRTLTDLTNHWQSIDRPSDSVSSPSWSPPLGFWKRNQLASVSAFSRDSGVLLALSFRASGRASNRHRRKVPPPSFPVHAVGRPCFHH